MKRHKCDPSEMTPPSDPLFWMNCKTCGAAIEPVLCRACEGTGAKHGVVYRTEDCPRCRGTGVKRWKKV